MLSRKFATLLLIALLLASTGIFPASSVSGSAPSTTPIDSCGVVINEPGYYVITQDLINTEEVCIHVNTSNVIIDGAGHTLTGNSRDTAIAAYNYNMILENITVTNLTISRFNTAVNFTGVNGGEISFLNIYNIGGNDPAIGLGVRRPDFVGVPTTNIVVKNNELINCTYGIETLFNSSNNSIINNTLWVPEPRPFFMDVRYYGHLGIYFYGGSGNLAENNTIVNYDGGIHFRMNSNSTARKNRIYGPREGIVVESFNINGSVYIRNNLITTNYSPTTWGIFSRGISLQYGHNTFVLGNEIRGTTMGITIHLEGDNNTIAGNHIFNSTWFAIGIDPKFGYISSGNIIANNTLELSGDRLMALYGLPTGAMVIRNADSTKVMGNTIRNTYGFGITILSSNNSLIKGNKIINTTNATGVRLLHPGLIEGAISMIGTHNNTITENVITENDIALFMNATNFSEISSNRIYGNEYGLRILQSYHNEIYNNFFNNTINVLFLEQPSTENYFNVSKTRGFNIVGGPYLGGNFWANPNGTGFSETCEDNDKDGICDSPCPVLDVPQIIDYLPLTYPPKLPDLTITSISVTTKDPATLEQVIDVSIANIGEDAAPAFNVVVLVNGTVVGNKTVNSLAPRATSELTFTWKASKEGFYVITAIADPGYPNDKVIESNESNNELTVNFTVGKYEEERPAGRLGRETFGVLFDLWNLWTAWFFKNFEELTQLLQTVQMEGVNESSIAEIHALNETGVQLIKEAWQTDDLNEIRAQIWKYVKSPVLWYKAREAYLTEKKAVELLKKILQME